MSNSELRVALFILRLGLGAFLLLFGIDKLVAPATTVEVFTQYYGLVVSYGMVYAIGALEILLGLAFLAGLWKTLSYGLGLHAACGLHTGNISGATVAVRRESSVPRGDPSARGVPRAVFAAPSRHAGEPGSGCAAKAGIKQT